MTAVVYTIWSPTDSRWEFVSGCALVKSDTRAGKQFFPVVYRQQECPMKEEASFLNCCFELYLQQTRRDCLGSVSSSNFSFF